MRCLFFSLTATSTLPASPSRQITVINDLDYRYNQNGAESAGPTMTKKGERGKKELLKNAGGMLSSSGVRQTVLRETHTVHVEVARPAAISLGSKIGENIGWT